MKNHFPKTLFKFGLAGLALCAVAAQAHDIPDQYLYIGGHASQYWFDEDELGPNSYDTVTLPGLQFGARFAPNWSAQAWWERNGVKSEITRERTHVSLALASLRYHFHDTSVGPFEPYAGLAVGQLRFDHRGRETDKETVAGAEFGLQARVAEHWVFDIGARPLWTEWRDRFEGEVYAGLNLIFGATRKAEPEPLPAEPVVRDSDGDGVPDQQDQCPDTPAGVAVDAHGCPLDGDGDGVPDYLDACPNTPDGALVDERGCQVYLERDVRETLYVEFELNKAEIQQEFIGELAQLADMMRKYPSAQLRLEGHTDSTGAASYNMRLSGQRAESVKNSLVNSFGIDPSRIDTIGFGEEQPIADNSTADGRAQNRRVEAILQATQREGLYED